MKSTDTSKRDIANFLRDFKAAAEETGIFISDRPKNTHALIDLNITRAIQIEEMLALTPEDYCAGPEQDYDRPDDVVWIFGKRMLGVEVYIKLKIFTISNGSDRAKCISFHRAESKLSYPLKNC